MNELKKGLEGFFGTTKWYKTNLTNILSTDGVFYFAEKNDCHWLISDICLFLKELNKSFVAIEIKSTDKKIIVSFEDGDCRGIRKPVEYIKEHGIELPKGHIDIWKEGNVLLLPSEH